MNTTSLQEAIFWMANGMGLDPTRDRDQLIQYVNKYRNLLYNSYEEVQLFDDYLNCFTIVEFKQDCSGYYCPVYRGFTATLDMEGIVAAWESLEPVSLRSKFREVFRGKTPPRSNSVEIIPVNGTFATERDMSSVQKIKLYAYSKSDAGKTVVITGLDSEGHKVTLSVKLGDDVKVTPNKNMRSVTNLVLPIDLCGSVELSQEDGKILSVYPPGIHTPTYRRYRVHEGWQCSSGTVLVQSARRYIPISEPHDIVEVGDQLVIENAGRYFRYGENTLDAKERNAAQGYLNEMFRLILGMKDRSRGRQENDSPIFFKKTRRRGNRRQLPGYRRIR